MNVNEGDGNASGWASERWKERSNTSGRIKEDRQGNKQSMVALLDVRRLISEDLPSEKCENRSSREKGQ